MEKINIDNVIQQLASDRIEEELSGLDQAVKIVNIIAEAAVSTFRTSPNRFVIAERLHYLGSSIIAPLEEVVKQTDDNEVRTLGSLVLLQLGSREHIPWLLEVIRNNETDPCLAAAHLARNRIGEAKDAILLRLRSCGLTEIDTIVCLLTSLYKFDKELPRDLYERFNSSDVPWQVQKIIADFTSASKAL